MISGNSIYQIETDCRIQKKVSNEVDSREKLAKDKIQIDKILRSKDNILILENGVSIPGNRSQLEDKSVSKDKASI